MKSHFLNKLGVYVALTRAGFKRSYSPKYLKTPDKRRCRLYVQEQITEDGSFCIPVNADENFTDELKNTAVVFVSYNRPNFIDFYECTDPLGGNVEYVKNVVHTRGRDQTVTRIVMRYDSSKAKLVTSVEDTQTWLKLRSYTL